MMNFLNEYGSDLLLKTWEQLYISLIALGLGIIVAVPLGIALTRFPPHLEGRDWDLQYAADRPITGAFGFDDSDFRDREVSRDRCPIHLFLAANPAEHLYRHGRRGPEPN